MRVFGRPAAIALAAMLLATAGCKPSSLTPFGIDTREPETSLDNMNGLWEGTTTNGGEVRFQIGSNVFTTLLVQHRETGCPHDFESETATTIVDNAFSFDIEVDQGRAVVVGRFTSTTTCTGSYFFEGFATTGSCPTAGSGLFTASKSL